jgi:uncharacterized membrane protein
MKSLLIASLATIHTLAVTTASTAQTSIPLSSDIVLPELYDVTGVASDDVLNIRLEPDVDSEIVGTLAYDDASVEVVRLSDDGGWGLVNAGERSGWVSMHFMSMQEHDNVLFERPLSCFGTEPFWSLVFPGDGTTHLEEFGSDQPPASFDVSSNVKQPFIPNGLEMAELVTDENRFNVVLSRDYCDDGMSDAEFGIVMFGLLLHPEGQSLFSGCCSLEIRGN